MEIAGDYLFDAPQNLVWDSLLDPNVLGSIMPGGKGFEKTGESHYDGVLEVKVGPVQGTFQGQIQLSDIVVPEHYKIQVDGKGAPGFVKANGTLQLEARGNQTFMVYSGQAQVGGRIASVGQRLVDSAARSIIKQSLEALNEYLKVQVAQQPAPAANIMMQETVAAPTPTETVARITASGEFKRPSQMGLGLNVAKDVFNDIVPARYQLWLIAGIILVIAIIILLITRR